MKNFLLVCILFLSSVGSAFAQEETSVLKLGDDNLYSYEKVFEAPGKTKDEIFGALKSWVIKNVKSQANTNNFDEKEKSNISTTQAFPTLFSSWVDFKMNIDLKDGKYRLSATSFIFHNLQGIAKNFGDYSGLVLTKKNKVKVLEDVESSFSKMLTSIQGSITTKSDW